MAFDQLQSVPSDLCRQLPEKHRRIFEENQELEARIRNIRVYGEQLIEKREQCRSLCGKIQQLAHLDNSSPSSQTTGLRVVDSSTGVGSGVEVLQNSMSWDHEGLTISEDKILSSDEPNGDSNVLDKAISRLERQLTTNKIELELIEKEMKGENENRQSSKNEGRRRGNMEPAREQRVENMNYLTAGDVDMSPSSSGRTNELENVVNLQNKRIEELLEQNHELENRANVLTKQKEELIRVNHQWDEQYRLLKDDRSRVIAELQKKVNTDQVPEAERQGQNVDVHRLIQEKETRISQLTEANEALSEEIAGLRQKQEKTDSLWLAAKKMITEEREARSAAIQQTQVIQQRNTKLGHDLENEKKTQVYLKREIERLTALLVPGSERSSSGSSSSVGGSPLPSDVKEQIEMLKQQIRVYADDFANERSDRERIQADKETLKEKLNARESEIALLKEQVRIYQDDFRKERQEKERIQRQLRDRRPITVVQAQDEPWYLVPPNDYAAVGGANPVQRRQPLYHERNYRAQANYTPREIQELAFQQQQQILARGNEGHPGALCHGCEVDRDVIDGNGPRNLKCPRCDRKFPSKEKRAFDEHIDKCTT